ncbi:MAG: cystathionine beta-lyase, partial [Lachnospiraceae bacterium]|nr:cystathionine beta-lyase [Lachnospiraceae bacterium]
MRYDFDELTDRRQTLSLKWDVDPDEIPMWVADMDFPTAPCVREAIEKRAAHGIFGYCIVPDAWYSAYQTWWEKHHGLSIEKEWLIFTTGVIPAMSTA